MVTTWELNGSDIGRAKLYFNGEYAGQSGPVREPFLWDTSKVTMRLGTGNYVGLMDDISLFNKALTAEEIRILYDLKNGVGIASEIIASRNKKYIPKNVLVIVWDVGIWTTLAPIFWYGNAGSGSSLPTRVVFWKNSQSAGNHH